METPSRKVKKGLFLKNKGKPWGGEVYVPILYESFYSDKSSFSQPVRGP